MRSFRYHLVSVAAVLLALGLGIALGASSYSEPILGALHTGRADLTDELGRASAERDAARAQQAQSDRALAAAAPSLLSGRLARRSVVLLAAPDAAPADLDAVSGLVGQAGGQVTGRLGLTDAALAPERADALRTLVTRVLPAGVQLPPTTDAGTLTGALLGALVTRGRGPASSPAEVGTAFTALSDGGFLQPGAAPAPAQVALVVTGGGSAPSAPGGRADALAKIAGALRDGGAGTVVASRSATGDVAAVRADPGRAGVSTVDDVGTTAGRIATVLAAAEQTQGRSGGYGSAPGAQPLPGAGAPPA